MKKALIITYIIVSHIVFLYVITAIKGRRTNDFHERLWQEMSWNGFCYSRIKEINDGKVLPADELRLWQKIAWASTLYAYKEGTLDYILSRRIKREQIRTQYSVFDFIFEEYEKYMNDMQMLHDYIHENETAPNIDPPKDWNPEVIRRSGWSCISFTKDGD